MSDRISKSWREFSSTFTEYSKQSIFKLNNKINEEKYKNGIDVIEKDWDNLIILDACRYDYFSEVNSLNGELTSVVSRASQSEAFIEKTFSGRELHDTIYITANPYGNDLSSGVFFTMKMAVEEWNYNLNTVLPSDLVGLASDIHNKFPNKRLIIHFMQPHEPHLGQKAEEMREGVDLRGYDIHHANSEANLNREGINSWMAARRGLVDDNEIREAYRQTLKIVLDEVEELIKKLGGKSTITSDHGEMLGERVLSIKKCYGHPSGLKTKELREVPWFTTQHGDRRKITPGEPRNSENLAKIEVNQRLQALGYH